jgi:hypothetical protein
MCVKLRIISNTAAKPGEKKTDIKIFDFDSKSEFGGLGSKEDSKKDIKYLDKPELYLNLCKSTKVLAPMTSDFKLADPNSNPTWKIIPVSFEPESRVSSDLVIYDAHINDTVFNVALKDKKIMNSILYYILRKFQFRLGENIKFDLMNADVQKFKYFSKFPSKEKPDRHIMNPECDPNELENIRAEMKKLKEMTQGIKKEDVIITAKPK